MSTEEHKGSSPSEDFLLGFGYRIYREPYDNFGLLRSMDDVTIPFEFQGEEHYSMIGDIVAKIVQETLVSKYGLEPIKLPNTKKGPHVILFSTSDFLSKSPTQTSALILIQGLGQGVKAGVWSRSVAINESFSLGTMLPLVDAAIKANMAILIMNPNERLDENT